MEDEEIYQLYWKRSEQAITATHEKYGGWCQGIAYRILNAREESEECVSDTYFTVWNRIPPQKPRIFRAWLGKITRNLALDRYRYLTAEKRGGHRNGPGPGGIKQLRLRNRKPRRVSWTPRRSRW